MGGMLPAKSEDLHASFAKGLAQVALCDGEIVGYVRLKPLLSANLARGLGIGPLSVHEVGSAMVRARFRSHGLYSKLRNSLYLNHLDNANRNGESALILGTTVYPAVVRSIGHAREEGIDISIIRHTDLPMIAALTCVCESGEMRGMHLGCGACRVRIDSREAPRVNQILSLPVEHSQSPCVMHVHDMEMASYIDATLRDRFGNAQNFVDYLKNQNYYD